MKAAPNHWSNLLICLKKGYVAGYRRGVTDGHAPARRLAAKSTMEPLAPGFREVEFGGAARRNWRPAVKRSPSEEGQSQPCQFSKRFVVDQFNAHDIGGDSDPDARQELQQGLLVAQNPMNGADHRTGHQ